LLQLTQTAALIFLQMSMTHTKEICS